MTADLDTLYQKGCISFLTYRFAELLRRSTPNSAPSALVGAAAALHQVAVGHVCADLPALAGKPVQGADDGTVCHWPEATEWLRSLAASSFVSAGELVRPLVLDGAGRLYLHRYFEAERDLARLLRDRATAAPEPVDEDLLLQDAALLFGADGTDERATAAMRAIRGRLTVLTGGPGAGKTTLVTAVLMLLIRQFRAVKNMDPRILLLAPTGKAARRIAETVERAAAGTVAKLGADAESLAAALPSGASTIHRALGLGGGDRSRFGRAPRTSILAADAVVVDEASMVDPSLMYALLRRVSPEARVIVVGDKDQLASVESGALLGDIFAAAQLPGSPLSDSAVALTGSFRFHGEGGIGRLARAINAGDDDGALGVLTDDPSGEIEYVCETDPVKISTILGVTAAEAFGPVSEAREPMEMLAALARFRVLTPHRRGRLGRAALNQMIEKALESRGLLRPDHRFYDRRPLLITQNHYEERLFNGDTGIVTFGSDGLPVAAFEAEGGVRSVSIARLPEVETAFAMTVHKSQGSEFDHVILVMPERPSPVTVRELLYTAITRARIHLTLIASDTVLRTAIRTVTHRSSGLKDRLIG